MERTVIAIFSNTDDETDWLPFLAEVPEALRVIYGENFTLNFENMKRIGIAPCLCIISSKLYPIEKKDIVTAIKRIFPHCEFLIIAQAVDPSPPLRPFIADMVRHLFIRYEEGMDAACPSASFSTAITNLVEGCRWQLDDSLNKGARVEEFTLSSSEQ